MQYAKLENQGQKHYVRFLLHRKGITLKREALEGSNKFSKGIVYSERELNFLVKTVLDVTRTAPQ